MYSHYDVYFESDNALLGELASQFMVGLFMGLVLAPYVLGKIPKSYEKTTSNGKDLFELQD